jgi:hypothetical protein
LGTPTRNPLKSSVLELNLKNDGMDEFMERTSGVIDVESFMSNFDITPKNGIYIRSVYKYDII